MIDVFIIINLIEKNYIKSVKKIETQNN